MTPRRSLLLALLSLALSIDARPIAWHEQFPRGLMASASPRSANRACTIETRPLSFGIYDPLADRDLDATAQIIYVCLNGNGNGGGGGGGGGGNGGGGGGSDKQAIRVELWTGAANTFDRAMRGAEGGNWLNYNIYLDATRQSIWGNGFSGTEAYIDSHPPNGTPVIVPAFGRVFASQNVVSGVYVDTVHVVILF
jgi:spore coat protein U-like protein